MKREFFPVGASPGEEEGKEGTMESGLTAGAASRIMFWYFGIYLLRGT